MDFNFIQKNLDNIIIIIKDVKHYSDASLSVFSPSPGYSSQQPSIDSSQSSINSFESGLYSISLGSTQTLR
jgi:hypothetical protein